MSACIGKRPDYYHGSIVFHKFKKRDDRISGDLSRWRLETPDKGLQERCMKKSIPV